MSLESPSPDHVPRTNRQVDHATDILIWDRTNDRSIVNLVDEKAGMNLEMSRKEKPELFELDEMELMQLLDDKAINITPTDNRLRMRFWLEYDYAQSNHAKMIDLARVAAGSCELQFLRLKYFRRPEKLCWLLCPPQDYMMELNEVLKLSLRQMRKIVATPFDSNVRLGELQAKIHTMLEARAYGAPVQKTLSIQGFLPGVQTARTVNEQVQEESALDLSKRLQQAKEMAAAGLNGGVVETTGTKV